jgi:hypothetical protein
MSGTDFENRIVVIFGQKHTGKTYLANKIADRLYRGGHRVVCVSPSKGFDFIAAPIITDARPAEYEKLAGRSVIVKPEADETAETAISFAWHLGQCTLIVDEIDNYCTPWDCYGDLLNIIKYGRHKEINLIGIAQRPANVNRSLTSQADLRIIFRVTEPADRKYLSKFCEADDQEIAALPDRKFLTFSTIAALLKK